MYQIFHDLPDALENNANLPYRISFRPKESPPILPNIQTSNSENIDELLIKESQAGLDEKLKKYILPYIDKENKLKRVREHLEEKSGEEIIEFYSYENSFDKETIQ